MKLIIDTNNDKEVSGTVAGKYFVIYKDMLDEPMISSDTLACVAMADELATLRKQLAEARKVIEPFAELYNKQAGFVSPIVKAAAQYLKDYPNRLGE